ncbi:Wzz/FepE/Etk N-terminal domain-containing protein [Streptomyces sp. CB01881]|uniref:Wzz/FepE/Etk N-terminal domain-containing protein n=1 Tax=Streptomyces sp. CB01881 TaxID=2078691 RepID=UPI000CDBB1BF|nr:Wzz/FepE/Etk N-terminal domain-containing protein [Streptomyces sp. CB01881]AUY52575.1 polysaccharide biosynthesis protein [Streptomyces sp. CB01881]TYC70293.1 polysaccharide biosynthesis protein [Streptomyces sp. CB01881]
MTTSTTSESPAAAPLLDLQQLVAAVRRRRRLWCSLALVGLLLGAAVAVLMPPPPSAVVKLLVAHEGDQPNDSGTLIRTDVAVLQTTAIAGKALQALGAPDKPEDFMKAYTGLGLTNNLLEIDVTGRSDAEAVARAKALADAFVADHVRRIQEAADAEAKALLDQQGRMREELAQINQAIGDGAQQNGPKASASLESLYSSRADLTSRITEFGQRAAAARVGTPRLVAGTQIVDAPHVVRKSLPVTAATDAAIGLVLGLVVGLAWAAVGTVVADRPVLRRDIAANLGASVVAEFRRRPRGPAGRLQGRRARVARTRLTTTLARTVRGSAEAVSLLELGCAGSTSEIALDLGRALGEEGPVVVVDGLPGPQLARRRPQPGDPAVVGGESAPAPAGAERRLGVGSVAPGTAWTDLRYLGTRTVLVVRAGHGNTAWLHTVARQLADQDIAVIGVVLIDPDPRDRTDGTLWDGPPAPARGRSGSPARQNGTGRRRTERRPMWTARVPDSDQEAR